MKFENKVKRKTLNWKNKNILLLESLTKNNLDEFRRNVQFEGALVELSDYLTEEEIKVIDEIEYEKITEELEDLYVEKFELFFREINNYNFLEKIFNLIVKRGNRLNLCFIKGYFAFTKNHGDVIKRINYIRKYCDEINFSILIMGSMLNEDEKVYFKVLNYIKKNSLYYIPSVVLSSRVIWEDRFYNYKSWEHFYLNHIDELRNERKQKNKKIDSFSSMIYFFVFYQHNGLCNKQLKIENLVKIYHFMINDYKVRYQLRHHDFVLIHMYNEKLKELNFTMKVLQNKIRNNQRSQFRSLMLSTKQKQIEDFLKHEVSKVIQKISPEECLRFFKKIKIDSNNYKNLEEYIKLNKKIKRNKKIFNMKKPHKI